MNAIALTRIHSRTRELAPGFIVSLIVAAAASFLSEHYGAPVMLFALLLGMALNFLASDGACKAGIEFTARTVLRIGVALLGMRITLEQIAALGWKPVALVVILVVVTIGVSVIAAKALGFQRLFGMLTGGATAICGASAALALAAALPNHPQKERATLFTVIGVSALSTLAMIVYPMIANWLSLSPQVAGVFLGGDHPRCRPGRRRWLQPVDRNWRYRNSGQVDAGGDAAAGDRVCGDGHAHAGCRSDRQATTTATVVRRRFSAAGLYQQHRLGCPGGARFGQ
ncbi:hypothetical protein TMM008_26210 [Pseudomonas sp. 008]|nr:hypothetical protein TMM008_26210 [Pseudomonas sp. 008]